MYSYSPFLVFLTSRSHVIANSKTETWGKLDRERFSLASCSAKSGIRFEENKTVRSVVCTGSRSTLKLFPTLNLFLENCLWSTEDLVFPLPDPPPSAEEPASKWWLRSSLPWESFRMLGSHFLERRKEGRAQFPDFAREKQNWIGNENEFGIRVIDAIENAH